MVHRKSEYRLSYKWLPQHLCQATRENLADYRLRRRRTDLDHQSWAWEGEAAGGTGCDCDEEFDREGEERARHLPVPENRAKHNMLLEQWRMDRYRSPSIPLPMPPSQQQPPRHQHHEQHRILESDGRSYRAAGAPAGWEGTAQRLTRMTESESYGGGIDAVDGGQHSFRNTVNRDVAAGKPTLDQDDLVQCGTGGERWAERVPHHPPPVPLGPSILPASYREPPTTTMDNCTKRAPGYQPAVTEGAAGNGSGARHHFQPTIAGYRSRTHRSVSAEPRRRKMDIAPTEPTDHRVLAGAARGRPAVKFRKTPEPSRQVALSRGVGANGGGSTPFLPYGFANKVDNIGSKSHTNNVQASSKLVSPATVTSSRALKVKDSELSCKQPYLQNLTRSKRWPTHSVVATPVNHSSLWMSEYSRNFTRAMRG